MAVEKSYARLGFFIVVAVVVILATALLFIQRMRSRAVISYGHLHQRERQRTGHLEPSSVPRRTGGPRHRPTRRSARDHRSKSTSRCS